MITLTIDDRQVEVEDGCSVLRAAQKAGVRIPTLCHHPAIEPYGGCRLCVVDVVKEDPNRSQLVVACMALAQNGMRVRTQTEEVREARKTILALLNARCPGTPKILRLAREYGLSDMELEQPSEHTECVLCGLCTRVCERLGTTAISIVDRGTSKRVAAPLDGPPCDCIGCLACVRVCPTGNIKYQQRGDRIIIWKKEFELLRCRVCGTTTMTRAQAESLKAKSGMCDDDFQLCDACKRQKTAAAMAALATIRAIV